MPPPPRIPTLVPGAASPHLQHRPIARAGQLSGVRRDRRTGAPVTLPVLWGGEQNTHVASCRLRVAGCRLQVFGPAALGGMIHTLQVAGCGLR
eukprot:196959-Chlamydomonas_euryale.AAC.1